MKVLVETSARHVHLSRKDIDALFGKDYNLSIKRNLSQPGQFLSNEKINLLVNGHNIDGISVLGPERDNTQVEISLTDSRKLKLNVPIRESGDILGTPGGILVGPNGSIEIKKGIIVAKRHIHMPLDDALKNGFENGEECNLEIKTNERSVIFSQTIVRVSNKFSLAAHIDTDESNAAGITSTTFGKITKKKLF